MSDFGDNDDRDNDFGEGEYVVPHTWQQSARSY